jgi:transposase-like protein
MKTQLSKPARHHASYTDQFKQEALELWRRSGRSAAKVGAELGIPSTTALSLGATGARPGGD